MPLSTPRKGIHPAWIIVGVSFFTLLVVAGFRSAPSVLIMPLEADFGWSRTQVSLAISINILVYGLVSPFAAALMERFGMRRVVMVALGVISTGALLTTQITSPWQLDFLWGLVVGAGTGSMALVFSATIASRWFVQRRGVVVGMLSAANSTGQLVFLPIFAWLVQRHGWRAVSMAVGGFALLMVPLVWKLLREDPQEVGLRPYGADEDWKPFERAKGNPAKLSVRTLRDAFKRVDFWILGGTFFVCGFSTNGLIGTHFIPACIDAGMPMQIAANLLAIIGVFDIVGTMLSGWLTDRMNPKKLLFSFYFLRGISLFLLPSILFPRVHPVTMVFAIFYGMDWIATVPPTLALCRGVLDEGRTTIVYGWIFACHQIGASIAAYLAGWLRVEFGNYSVAFYGAGALCLVAAFAILRVGKTQPTYQTI